MAFMPIVTLLIPVVLDIATNPWPAGSGPDGSGDSKPHEFEPEVWGLEPDS